VLHTFERISTLPVIIELAAVPFDDRQQLDHALVGIGLDARVRSLDFAVELQQALSKNEGICVLLVLDEQGSSLLGLLDILLPQECVSWVDRGSSCLCCWVTGDQDCWQFQFLDCLLQF
jgi:hypothetical protein